MTWAIVHVIADIVPKWESKRDRDEIEPKSTVR